MEQGREFIKGFSESVDAVTNKTESADETSARAMGIVLKAKQQELQYRRGAGENAERGKLLL